ncbi:MAG: hypothetical protein AAB900_00340 [Patescibacteria group bacterium]
MSEKFEQPEQKIVSPEIQEKISTLTRLLAEIEIVTDAPVGSPERNVNRQSMKEILSLFQGLNRPNLESELRELKAAVQRCIDEQDFDHVPEQTPDQQNPIANWNPEGNLNEEQFNKFKLLYLETSKKLGLEITATKVIRHD